VVERFARVFNRLNKVSHRDQAVLDASWMPLYFPMQKVEKWLFVNIHADLKKRGRYGDPLETQTALLSSFSSTASLVSCQPATNQFRW
jgi:hypothetical protein